jgi:hypothetical protein
MGIQSVRGLSRAKRIAIGGTKLPGVAESQQTSKGASLPAFHEQTTSIAAFSFPTQTHDADFKFATELSLHAMLIALVKEYDTEGHVNRTMPCTPPWF